MAIALSETADALKDIPEWEIRKIQDTYNSNLPKVDPKAEKYTIHSFKWTDTEYTPRQLLDNFQQFTPFLFITTQGFLGRDEWLNTVASDEVYWLKGIVKLPRIVVRNDYNAYLSIPIYCKNPVIPYRNGVPDGQETTLKKLLQDNTHAAFVFADEERHSVYHGPGTGDAMKFGVLMIVDQYNERYLMGHALCDGRIYHEACVIPIYMPVTMSIAAAMDQGDHKRFYKTMLDMYNFTNNVPKAVAFPRFLQECNEIMLYDQKPAEGEYDYLKPSHYVTLRPKKYGERHVVSSHMYDALDVPKASTLNAPVQLDRIVSKRARSKSEDKPRMSSPPPETVPLDQRGGARGPETNIGQMSRQGYSVVDVEPIDVLLELTEVLRTGVVPREPVVKMVDISIDVQSARRATPWPVAGKPMPSEPGPPLQPRSAQMPMARTLPSPPVKAPPATHNNRVPPSTAAPEPPKQLLSSPSVTEGQQQKDIQKSLIAELNKRRGSLQHHVPKTTNRGPQTLPKSMRVKGESTTATSPSPVPGQTYEEIPTPTYVKFPQTCPVKGQPSVVGNEAPIRQAAPPVLPPMRDAPTGAKRSIPSVYLSDTQPQTTGKGGQIKTVADIPSDVSCLDCEGIGQCLELLNLAKHKDRFVEEQINGSLLSELDIDMLVTDFGFSRFEATKLTRFSKKGWRPNVHGPQDESFL